MSMFVSGWKIGNQDKFTSTTVAEEWMIRGLPPIVAFSSSQLSNEDFERQFSLRIAQVVGMCAESLIRHRKLYSAAEKLYDEKKTLVLDIQDAEKKVEAAESAAVVADGRELEPLMLMLVKYDYLLTVKRQLRHLLRNMLGNIKYALCLYPDKIFFRLTYLLTL